MAGKRLVLPFLGAAVLLAPATGANRAQARSTIDTPYAMAMTVSCLKKRGAELGPVRPTNARLRALRDLAQKTSVQMRLGGVVVGIAFSTSADAAAFLYELLQVPNDPLSLEQRRNVVILSPKRASAARSAVISCLRT